ncbi:murein hydrolase activator EnvC family protein [Pelagerythrobacter aerophilus]|uniref:Metalloendopeptidase n=1 Tax=Pelagerythrobacter aerophilus TaxID=2306995 RepID=A0A418NLJ5_9SPHN|nr:peptidoglycan DD-metalloendopeptidase family protein [Pelagerythrobacter aerophilus]RIV76025.1 metalloendopeptidase [Pelagerythrobacter aerophilus]RIV80719.1 metalloendopeptidase [Pelagerythrobacter aerophilus]
MPRRATILVLTMTATAGVIGGIAAAQRADGVFDPGDARAALREAREEARAAQARGARLEAEARAATEAAEKTAREAAALAARIQQAEADIAAAEARIALIDGQRQQLDMRLAERREPLLRLTAALQKFARRPLALSALRPGSLRETVYLRALLETTVPEVRQRTAALRAEIARGARLETEALQALAALRQSEAQLGARRQRLVGLESRQRLASRRATGVAAREAERALALAEEARDLDGLIARLDDASALRRDLAALPGPMIRPASPESARVSAATGPTPTPSATAPPDDFQLPVVGQTVAGFGSVSSAGVRSNGLSLAPRPAAQVVAPGSGRVAFAGPYRGYDRIVIIEHEGGWTSLVTGLSRVDVDVGEALVSGAPLGVAAVDAPVVTLELRRDGTPVNPLDYLG